MPVWPPLILSQLSQHLFTVIIVIVDVITLLGNALVVLAYGREPALRRPAHNMYIFSLAVTDLAVGLFSIPAYAATIILGSWPLGKLTQTVGKVLDEPGQA